MSKNPAETIIIPKLLQSPVVSALPALVSSGVTVGCGLLVEVPVTVPLWPMATTKVLVTAACSAVDNVVAAPAPPVVVACSALVVVVKVKWSSMIESDDVAVSV